MSSSAPLFKADLLARLVSLQSGGLSGVMVSWGNPYPNRMQSELVMISKVTPANSPGDTPRGLGINARDERYQLKVIASVIGRPRDSQQTLEERAFAIHDTVVNSLVAWRSETPPFGGRLGNGWITIGSPETDEGMTFDPATKQPIEREAAVIINIEVVARVNI